MPPKPWLPVISPSSGCGLLLRCAGAEQRLLVRLRCKQIARVAEQINPGHVTKPDREKLSIAGAPDLGSVVDRAENIFGPGKPTADEMIAGKDKAAHPFRGF